MEHPSAPSSRGVPGDSDTAGAVVSRPPSPRATTSFTPSALSVQHVEPLTSGSIPVLTPEQVALLTATERLRHELGDLALPFEVPGVGQALHERDDVLERLDTFVLPRLRRLDAPLLVVVGGSAGSGKSTLTNSLVGVRVSPEGVLRPTTRAPVLAHHPRDAGAFLSRRILPGLTRTTVTGGQPLDPGDDRGAGPGSIRLVPHWAVTPGLAIIDSPDLNSRVEGNRELARQLFGVADLWVFVATGTDYANAAPWELLAEAVERQVSVAVVLNRMRDSESGDVRHHFATMLRDAGLASAAFFTMPEVDLDNGLLPSWRMVALQTWLARQVNDAQARDGHVRRAVVGTLAYVGRRCDQLVVASRAQAEVEQLLRVDLTTAFGPTLELLHRRVDDGVMIGPGVEAAWRELTGPAESATSRSGRWLGRATSQVGVVPPSARPGAVADALRSGMVALLRTEARTALNRLADRWHGQPAVAEFVGEAELFALPDDFAERVDLRLRRWQQEVEARVSGTRPGSGTPTPVAQAAAVGVLSLAVGADAGWIGPHAHALAETRLSRGEVRDHVGLAREQVRAALAELLELAAGRPNAMLEEIGADQDRPEVLRGVVEQVRQALAAVR
jgi:energy-coupling factor transporter ATP-binding protein EcfA2